MKSTLNRPTLKTGYSSGIHLGCRISGGLETIGDAVKREVGVEVEDIRYFSGQSWTFPYSQDWLRILRRTTEIII